MPTFRNPRFAARGRNLEVALALGLTVAAFASLFAPAIA